MTNDKVLMVEWEAQERLQSVLYVTALPIC